MATVILPMGYPLLSGSEADLIVYQGSLVRSYNVPSDPRSSSQLQNRRFLSDFGKMRGTAGLYARAALRSNLGPKWGAIVYQYAKGDLNSCWSNAVSAWASFSEPGREAWRAVAPYEATFNDKGLIFFALLRVLHHAVEDQGFEFFGLSEWEEEDSAAALAWWVQGFQNTILKGTYPLPEYKDTFGIVGTETYNASAAGGYYLFEIQTFEFVFYGWRAQYFGHRYSGAGVVKFYLDGVLWDTVDLSAGLEAWQVELGYSTASEGTERSFKGLHVAKYEVVSGYANIDTLRIY